MSISIACPKCGKTYDVPETRAGQSGNCSCGATISIPGTPAQAAAVAPQAAFPQPTVLRKPVELLKCPACSTVLPPRTDICPRCGTNRLAPPPAAPTISGPVASAMTPPSAYPPPAPGYAPPPKYEDPAIASARLLVPGHFANGRPLPLTIALILFAAQALYLLGGTVVGLTIASSKASAELQSGLSFIALFFITIQLAYLALLWFVWIGQGWARTLLLVLTMLGSFMSMAHAFTRGHVMDWVTFIVTVAVVVILISPSTAEWCAE